MFNLALVGTVASVIVGGAVAAATLVGVVHSTVESGADNPANSNSAVIQYGSN